jgi:hypothetical protein
MHTAGTTTETVARPVRSAASPSGEGVVELDEERKAAMVPTLMVVLCGDRGTQPIVNAGSL